MENPYAYAAAPAAATPELQKISDYQLAIGKNVDHYLTKFERYDQGESTAGWNWPAFFVTSGWYLYRKMWLWALLNLFFPIILLVVLGIVGALVKIPPVVTALLFFGLILAEQLALAVFANSLYWRHINGIIRDMPRVLADKPDRRMRKLERDGGTSIGAAIGVLCVVGYFGLGIVAAIAFPAYQTFTIRAQVREGLALADGAQLAVADYYAKKSEWPLDAEAAGLRPISGRYVDSVTVANGSVVVTFGDRANRLIASQRVILVPGVTRTGQMFWTCADHGLPPEITIEGPGPHGSDVDTKYLPKECRPAAGT